MANSKFNSISSVLIKQVEDDQCSTEGSVTKGNERAHAVSDDSSSIRYVTFKERYVTAL